MNHSFLKKLALFGLCLMVMVANALAEEFAKVVAVLDGGMLADAKVDGKGGIHLVWVAKDDVWYAKSANYGDSFSKAIRVNSEPGTVHPAKMFRGPELAIGGNGQIHAIWYVSAFQRKLPKDQWGVHYSHLNPDHTAFVPATNLNHRPSDNYSLAADGKGKVAVVWMAGKVYLNQSRNEGESFGEPEVVTEADPCECCASRTLFGADGTLFINYRDKAGNNRDMFVLASSKQGRGFTKNKLGGESWQINACPMTSSSLLPSGKGLVAAWETKGLISFARLDATGKALASTETPVPIKGKWPLAVAAPDGMVLLSWKVGTTLQWKLYNSANHQVATGGSSPSSNAERHTAVVIPSGGFILFP